jgi:putative NADH-flavin reductase
MKLTIVAATGGIGRQLVDQALAAGHDVTAVARTPSKLPPAPMRVIAADLAAPDPVAPVQEALRTAVAGADAVLSALGPRSKADAGVTWRGTQALTRAMQEAGVHRILVVSAAPIGTVASPARPHPPRHDPGDGLLMRNLAAPIVRAVFRDNYADLARMEDVLRDSELDWTAVRPPRLTRAPMTGRYRTALGRNLRRGLVISRADVAHYMLRAIGDPQTYRQTVGLAR